MRYEIRSTTDDDGEDAFVVCDTETGEEVYADYHQGNSIDECEKLNANCTTNIPHDASA